MSLRMKMKWYDAIDGLREKLGGNLAKWDLWHAAAFGLAGGTASFLGTVAALRWGG